MQTLRQTAEQIIFQQLPSNEQVSSKSYPNISIFLTIEFYKAKIIFDCSSHCYCRKRKFSITYIIRINMRKIIFLCIYIKYFRFLFLRRIYKTQTSLYNEAEMLTRRQFVPRVLLWNYNNIINKTVLNFKIYFIIHHTICTKRLCFR